MSRNAYLEYIKGVHMGYEIYEEPMVSGFVYYYDTGQFTSLWFCKKFLLALEKYGYRDITNIKLGKHKLVDGILEDYVVQYKKKDLSAFNLDVEIFKWVNDDEVASISFVHKEKRRWMWDLTWYKNYHFPDNVSVSDYTFNCLSLVSSYESLDNKDTQNKYVGLFCELSDLFTAFYGRIEDVSTAVDVLDRTKEKVFTPRYIQTVYWGNYFGNCYSAIEYEYILSIPDCYIRRTSKGVFLSLTDDIYDSKNHPDYKSRRRILKHLTKLFHPKSEKNN